MSPKVISFDMIIMNVLHYKGSYESLRDATRVVYAELDAITEVTGMHFGMKDRILRLCSYLGTTPPADEVIQAIKDRLTAQQRRHWPRLTDVTLPVLFGALKDSETRLAVISNTNMTEGAIVHEALDFHGLATFLDYELYSDELGYGKPDPCIFEALVRVANVAPHEILHIGDIVCTDKAGARASGLQSILYDRRQRQPRGDDVIWSFSDLLARLT